MIQVDTKKTSSRENCDFMVMIKGVMALASTLALTSAPLSWLLMICCQADNFAARMYDFLHARSHQFSGSLK